MNREPCSFRHSLLGGSAVLLAIVFFATGLRPGGSQVGNKLESPVRVSNSLPTARTVARRLSQAVQKPAGIESLEARRLLPEAASLGADWRQWAPPRVTVAIHEGLPLAFEVEEIKRGADYTTWIGRNRYTGATLVGVGTVIGWDAVLAFPNASYDLRVRGDRAFITEQPEAFTCGAAPVSDLRPMAADSPVLDRTRTFAAFPKNGSAAASGVTLNREAIAAEAGASANVQAVAAVAPTIVDVIFFYDKTAEQQAVAGYLTGVGDTPEATAVPPMPLADVRVYMNAHWRAYLESANAVLGQSRVNNLRWNFLGAFRAAEYPATRRMQDDLDRFDSPSHEPSISATPMSVELGADQHVLIVGERDDFGALARLPGHHVVLGLAHGYTTLAHELGHNFGLRHDRDADHIPNSETGYNYGYSFAYSWRAAIGPAGPDGQPTMLEFNGLYGDVMSYASERLHYFSNPDLFLTGTELAGSKPYWTDPTLFAFGIAAGQLRAADAARVLREGAVAMAGYRTAAAPAIAPVIVTPPPPAVSLAAGQNLALSITATGATFFQWERDGTALTATYAASYATSDSDLAAGGIYRVTPVAAGLSAQPTSTIVGVHTAQKVLGAGTVVGSDIVHPTGNIYDQVLATGPAEAVTADTGQVTRTSYIDPDGDIVQVEFSGAGTLVLLIDEWSGPNLPKKYNQQVSYGSGRARLIITGANETTNLSVFSVGRKTAVNQALFKDDVSYDGVADLAYVAIASANGRFGGLRAADARFGAVRGFTGVYAPEVTFVGPVYVGGVRATFAAVPTLMLGSAGDVRITGGDLYQPNDRSVQVSGISQLHFVAGSDSHGTLLPAQKNRGRLEQGGIDVTTQLVVD